MADHINPDSVSPRARSGWNVAFGLWLIAAPFILGYANLLQPLRNDMITGLIIAILALIGTSTAGARWSRMLNILAGIWLLAAPLVLNYGSFVMNAALNDFIIGALVIIAASVSLSASTRYHHAHRHAYR